MFSSSSSISSPWSEPSFETVSSPSSYESEMSSVSQFEIKGSSKLFDLENFVDHFPPTQIIDYREIQKNQGIYPSSSSSSSSKELVLYKPQRQHLENLQERLEKVVKNVVHKEVKMLLLQAKGEKKKEQQPEHDNETSLKEEATDSTNEDDKHTVENAQDDNEGRKVLDKDLTMAQRQARTTTKLVAYKPDVFFEIPEDFKVDDETVNEFVPKDDILREIIAQCDKKYSFIDRLHGWDIECRMRLSGSQQFDKYFTHLESGIVMRSIREIMRFIFYEVNPKQMKETTRKRKAIELGE